MRFEETALPGVVIVEPAVFRDHRGFFFESWSREKFRAGGIDADFVQDNHSRSSKGVLRGLHLQWRHPQGKLVRALAGSILDVVADARRHSPTFGVHVAVELSAENFRQIWVPPGYVHGLCVLSETAEVAYKVDAAYDPGGELSVRWNDPALAIPWPVAEPILSGKDRDALTVDEAQTYLSKF